MRLFIVAAGWLLLFQEGKGAMGPWVGIVNKVSKCSDENQDLPSSLSMSIDKNGKYRRIVKEGSFDSNVGISNDSEMVARLMEFKNGRWNVVLERNFGGTCNALNTFIPKLLKLVYQQTPDLETYEDGTSVCTKPSNGKMVVPFNLDPITVETIPSHLRRGSCKTNYGTIDLTMMHYNARRNVSDSSHTYQLHLRKLIQWMRWQLIRTIVFPNFLQSCIYSPED
ncbi:hypothetical protein GE061_015590 [Apolygus lucorum]|uniref:Uncharacterized protein n=1 Tax=Apolygus lucorum TaxID=248454 RepID=A0A8S9XNN1_APOLU|nr:hypothetical protein GE061_015590 [Apolygus lucorum]